MTSQFAWLWYKKIGSTLVEKESELTMWQVISNLHIFSVQLVSRQSCATYHFNLADVLTYGLAVMDCICTLMSLLTIYQIRWRLFTFVSIRPPIFDGQEYQNCRHGRIRNGAIMTILSTITRSTDIYQEYSSLFAAGNDGWTKRMRQIVAITCRSSWSVR